MSSTRFLQPRVYVTGSYAQIKQFGIDDLSPFEDGGRHPPSNNWTYRITHVNDGLIAWSDKTKITAQVHVWNPNARNRSENPPATDCEGGFRNGIAALSYVSPTPMCPFHCVAAGERLSSGIGLIGSYGRARLSLMTTGGELLASHLGRFISTNCILHVPECNDALFVGGAEVASLGLMADSPSSIRIFQIVPSEASDDGGGGFSQGQQRNRKLPYELLEVSSIGHQHTITSLDFDSDSRFLFSVGYGGLLCRWKVFPGGAESRIHSVSLPGGSASSLKIVEDQRCVVVGYADRAIEVLDLRKANLPVVRIEAHEGERPIQDITGFARVDRQTFISSCFDGSIAKWTLDGRIKAVQSTERAAVGVITYPKFDERQEEGFCGCLVEKEEDSLFQFGEGEEEGFEFVFGMSDSNVVVVEIEGGHQLQEEEQEESRQRQPFVPPLPLRLWRWIWLLPNKAV